jgi:hypothetical protein
MYHSGKNPLRRVSRSSEEVVIPKGIKVRRLHKAFLRYHDPENWPILREALKRMGRADLIGNGKHHLIPAYQPVTSSARAGGVPGGGVARAGGGVARADGAGTRPGGVPRSGGVPRAGGIPRAGAGLPFRTQHTGLPQSGRASPQLKRRGRP